MNDEEIKAFKKIQERTAAEEVMTQVVREETADVSLMTTAKAKARLAAYERVSKNYTAFIERQAEQLERGAFEDSPFKELGTARLIAAWMIESESFLKEAEPLLLDSPRVMRNQYLERSFETLPEDVKNRLLAELAEKKREVLIWFVGRVQEVLLGKEEET